MVSSVGFRVCAIRSTILKRRSLLFSTDFWGVACGQSMVLNFFLKKVHKKLMAYT